jgi:small-conductance mechanosensitive channel
VVPSFVVFPTPPALAVLAVLSTSSKTAMDLLRSIIDYAETHAAELTWRLIAAIATISVAWLAARVARTTLRRLLSRQQSSRARTLQPLVQALVSVALLGTGVVLSLEQLGFDLTAVIAGAGVLGLAVGFGAQTLVKDVISGFFLIFDGVLDVGDHVNVDKTSGTVEELGLRLTKIRAADGALWYVPNGQIQVVGNNNRGWMRAMEMVTVTSGDDVPRALAIVDEVARAWAEERAEIVIEAPKVQGVLEIDAKATGVRLTVRVKPGSQDAAEQELGGRIRAAFAREGISLTS